MTVELLKRSLHRGLRQQWWFYRDAKGLEIDLLHTDGLRRLAIEAKSGATVQPEWASALLRFQRRLQKAGSDAELALIHGVARHDRARRAGAVVAGASGLAADAITLLSRPNRAELFDDR